MLFIKFMKHRGIRKLKLLITWKMLNPHFIAKGIPKIKYEAQTKFLVCFGVNFFPKIVGSMV